jgi:hypothetical protein
VNQIVRERGGLGGAAMDDRLVAAISPNFKTEQALIRKF